MPRKKQSRYCVGVYDMDTESTHDGYVTAFMADKFHSRLVVNLPHPKNIDRPSRKYIEARYLLFKLLDTLPEHVRLTQQNEIRLFFRKLNETCSTAAQYLTQMDSKLEKPQCYLVIHFANLTWDLDILKGMVFDDIRYEAKPCGTASDLIQLEFGNLFFRDFLKVTGFRSIKMAGQCCISSHKAEGEDVYNITVDQIPLKYDDYSEHQKFYMENDVLVMNESLNIILNRRENYSIKTLNDLPMTSTSFGRFRLKNNDEIIMEGNQKIYVPALLTMSRWKFARPFLAYLLRAYKGGYCAPNPAIQYKLLDDVVCFDAVSMYPDKMMFHRMLQCTKYTQFNVCKYTIEECAQHLDEDEARSALNKVKNVQYFINEKIDDTGLFVERPDDLNGGLYPWTGNVILNIKGVKQRGNCHMMPTISKFKVENIKPARVPDDGRFARHIEECNGKILSGDNIEIILTSVDLMLTMLAYDCEIVQIKKWLNQSWRDMLPVQKRDLWFAYQRKMHISAVLKRDRYSNNDYWQNEAGFNPDAINSLNDDDYDVFTHNYKLLVKADANGKYGMTVEKPLHPDSWIEKDDDGLPVIQNETVQHAMERLLQNADLAPKSVNTSDYCAGSSITMWARWQLISMMYCFFKHGIETYYCDTDSLFVSRSDTAFECVAQFNARKKALYYETDVGNGIKVNVDTAENLGQFELDKECRWFKTLGSKNYAYVKKNGDVKITIAGLNTSIFQKLLKRQLEKSEFPRMDFDRYYRPNTCVHPSACKKLLKISDNMGYDDKGLWRGCTLEPVGFYSIRMSSKYHVNNARHAAKIQGFDADYYYGMYNSPIYLTDKGFTFYCNDKFRVDEFEPLEENQTIKGGVV